jgi:hypothetical protein
MHKEKKTAAATFVYMVRLGKAPWHMLSDSNHMYASWSSEELLLIVSLEKEHSGTYIAHLKDWAVT